MDQAPNSEEHSELIITGSFNGLLGRLARIHYYEIWLTGSKNLKKAKKHHVEATMQMSEVSNLTGLTVEDTELFVSFSLIEVGSAGEHPRLSFRGVLRLVYILERFVDESVIR